MNKLYSWDNFTEFQNKISKKREGKKKYSISNLSMINHFIGKDFQKKKNQNYFTVGFEKKNNNIILINKHFLIPHSSDDFKWSSGIVERLRVNP